MFGLVSASRRAWSAISFLLLFFFTLLLEQSPDQASFRCDVGNDEHGSHDLLARDQRFRLGDAHAHMVARRLRARKMAETAPSISGEPAREAGLAGAAEREEGRSRHAHGDERKCK